MIDVIIYYCIHYPHLTLYQTFTTTDDDDDDDNDDVYNNTWTTVTRSPGCSESHIHPSYVLLPCSATLYCPTGTPSSMWRTPPGYQSCVPCSSNSLKTEVRTRWTHSG